MTLRKKLIVTALLAGLGTLGWAGWKYWQLGGQHWNWERVWRTSTGGDPTYDRVQYRAKGDRKAIDEPELVAASEAGIAAGTKGVAVAIGGETRFYPLYILQYHQVVNDQCGGKKIACSL